MFHHKPNGIFGKVERRYNNKDWIEARETFSKDDNAQ